jgi:hypothetical protein
VVVRPVAGTPDNQLALAWRHDDRRPSTHAVIRALTAGRE